jgi:uncharacterized protein (TIRG00374 family)
MVGSDSIGKKKKDWKHWVFFCLRWGIAVVGIYIVLSNMSLRDQVYVIENLRTNAVVEEKLAYPVPDDSLSFPIRDPSFPGGRNVPRSRVVNFPDPKQALEIVSGGLKLVKVIGVDLPAKLEHPVKPIRLLVVENPINPRTDVAHWIPYSAVKNYEVKVPYPRVQVGILSLVKGAEGWLLALALLVFPITFVITSYRWHELLEVLDINIGVGRVFVLTMVGSFYNTFMPGSTGGDALKAWYASKQTPHRMRAVMSVVVDRAIGLIALIIVGGVAACFKLDIRACEKVAIGAGVILFCVAVGLLLFYNPTLHRVSGLDFFLRKLPMQKQIRSAVDTMRLYGKRPGLALWALLISFPVHGAVVSSAMFAGMAFGLPLHWAYYWVAVPVIVLAGAIPISPQGAGVMEFFAIMLTRNQGVTISQAFALTMSIRLVQILWNLTGGMFVLRGGFHAPTAGEKEELKEE